MVTTKIMIYKKLDRKMEELESVGIMKKAK
jgi:hypothetical protein